jgi:hypothetical protein
LKPLAKAELCVIFARSVWKFYVEEAATEKRDVFND